MSNEANKNAWLGMGQTTTIGQQDYVTTLEARARSGGLGLKTAFHPTAGEKSDKTPPGLGLHNAIPRDVWEFLGHTIR